MLYTQDAAHKDEILKTVFNDRGRVEISRFKGLGEMPAKYLKATTMDPAHRLLLKVHLPDRRSHDNDVRKAARKTAGLVESLIGRKPELRFEYIQANAQLVRDIDV